MTDRYVTEQQRVLADLARQGSQDKPESSLLVSPGSIPGAWIVKVKSHVTDNVYSVRAVIIGSPGTVPVEIGQEVQAVNLAESFVNDGTLEAGTYVVMFRVGDKHVFSAQP